MAYIKNIKHIYENLDLTFKDIKEIFHFVGQNEIDLFEKFDGANLLIGYDFLNETPVVARSIKDIREGGLNGELIDEKYKLKPNVNELFKDAYDAITESFQKFGKDDLGEVFPFGKWISAEVISKNHRNLIQYDENRIVFHNVGFCSNEQKRILETKSESLFNELNEMNVATSFSNWKVCGPRRITLNTLSPDCLFEFCHKLNMIQILGRVKHNSTLGEYYEKWLNRKISSYMPNTTPSKLNQISKYMLKRENIGLRNIKKTLNENEKKSLNKIFENSRNILMEIKKPLEFLIHEFSNRLFENKNSSFVSDLQNEVERQRREVGKLIENLKRKGEFQNEVNHLVEKLRNVKNITSSCEGITFIHNDNLIKLEGNYIIHNRLKYLYNKLLDR